MPNTRITATTATVLRSIADDKSMAIFRTIAQSNDGIDSKYLKDKLKLTRKQYYSRLSRMTRSGLVKKRKGKYTLTTFGKVVYESQATVDSALSNLWKLKTIDSLEMSHGLSEEERQKHINTLLGKDKL
jgi:Mn-dependent DtxR family transcriptional regulator